MKWRTVLSGWAGFGGLFVVLATAPAADRPNIVFILADDLGYGDVRCFNPESRIPTPCLDRLAAEGMRFTDAHSSSSVCTPTRYSILTGRYNWRSRLQRGVLGGLSPRLIEPGRLTVAELLQQNGYATAAIGKWHLGMDWTVLPGKTISELSIETSDQVRNVDYGQPIRNGPNAVGFDFYFGISASLDMVPYAYIENDHLTVAPAADKSFPLFHGIEARQTRRGPAAPAFDASEVLPTLVQRAVDYIARQAESARGGKPFFLYLPLSAPHTPILPTDPWVGKSGLNAYADFVMQTDHGIGAILDALDRHGLAGNTLVIATSDNGCSPEAKFPQLQAAGHYPSYRFRGAKADLFEGGHRVPFVVRWPGRVAAGTTSGQLICLMDFMASCAEILKVTMPAGAAEDSISFLPALLGRQSSAARTNLIHHSINGSFAIREGPWKLLLCPDSGGWSEPRPGSPEARTLPPLQLYHLEKDLGETNNLQGSHPEAVGRLSALWRAQTGRLALPGNR